MTFVYRRPGCRIRRRRDFAVKRHGGLQCDQRSAMANVFGEGLVQCSRFFFKYAGGDADPGATKLGKALSADQRIRILHAGDHAGDSGGDQRIGARLSSAADANTVPG